MYEIYAIRIVETGAIVYVGVTKNGAKARFRQHLAAADSHYNGKLGTILQEQRTEVVILETTRTGKAASKIEKAWIRRSLDVGEPLCNRSDGGYAWPYINHKLFSAHVSKRTTEALRNPAIREKISRSKRGVRFSELHRRHISRAVKQEWKDPKKKKRRTRNISAAMKKKWDDPEFREKMEEVHAKACLCKYGCGFTGTWDEVGRHARWHCPNGPYNKKEA